MSSPFRDIPVSFLSEDKIARIANEWRSLHEMTFGDDFCVVEFLIHTFMSNRTAALSIDTFDRDGTEQPPAHVSFKPDVINVDRSIWRRADMREGYPQFIVAHEIGHILLHSDIPKGYSKDSNSQIKYFENEHSAEWQANKFAEHLILPKSVVERYSNIGELIKFTGAWEAVAKTRFADVFRPKLVNIDADHVDSACEICGNLSFSRRGLILKCKTCKQERSLFVFGKF
ncbi:ImmA/IrrE family metallo-endopeptidase [Methylobacterium sp. 77]|uniref:ImmA/IrrE family metallo-endopeptidase n=1 Tax=Methylobacterium sp. 77 TaxID=1101192 RepID=UPI0009DB85D8|nr:ImmA/IrrE family metallo-endopeptidase [Methylobacterium sp. 77]